MSKHTTKMDERMSKHEEKFATRFSNAMKEYEPQITASNRANYSLNPNQ